MGINVNQIQFPQLPNATSMRLCTAKTYDLNALLLSVVPKLIEGLTLPKKDWDVAYHQSLYGLNQSRRFVKVANMSLKGLSDRLVLRENSCSKPKLASSCLT